MSITATKVASILFRSTFRDLWHLFFAVALPLLLSSVAVLFRDGFLPWPFLVLVALLDASAIAVWLGDLRRNYLTLNATAASIALAVTLVGLVTWVARLAMMLGVALALAPSHPAVSAQGVLLNCSLGLLLTSTLVLLTSGWGSRTPWAAVLTLLTVTSLFGVPMWISELSNSLEFRAILAAESDLVVAFGTSLGMVGLSAFVIVVAVWASRSSTLRAVVQSG